MATTFTHPNANPLLAVPIRKSASGKEKSILNYIRALAMDNARIKVENANVTDMTDSTTATAATDTVAMVIPTTATDGSAGGTSSAPAAAFNTEMGLIENIGAEFGDWINQVRVRLGLPQLTWAAGSGTSGTLEAIAGAVGGLTGTTGALCINFTSGVAAMTAARNNFAIMLRALNEVAAAMGEPTLTDTPNRGTFSPGSYALADIPTAAADTANAGATSISDTEMDAFLAALANNIATLAWKFNAMVTGAALPDDLTDSSSGVSGGDTLVAMTVPPAYTSEGAGTCAPKAAFDTDVPKHRNNFADLTARVNLLLARYGYTELIDSSAGTANTELEAVNKSFTGVDGGTLCIDVTSATTTCTAMVNNIATLAAKINLLCPWFAITTLTDSTGGTASDTTVVAMATTDGGNDGTSDATMQDSVMDTFIDAVADAQATLAAKLAEMTGAAPAITKPLHLVADI